MDSKDIIRSLNMREAPEVLTLEKAADRTEFEALPVQILASGFVRDDCPCKETVCVQCGEITCDTFCNVIPDPPPVPDPVPA
jgi:hypothetical protein